MDNCGEKQLKWIKLLVWIHQCIIIFIANSDNAIASTKNKKKIWAVFINIYSSSFLWEPFWLVTNPFLWSKKILYTWSNGETFSVRRNWIRLQGMIGQPSCLTSTTTKTCLQGYITQFFIFYNIFFFLIFEH